MGRRYNLEQGKFCNPSVVVVDPCNPRNFFFRPTGNPDVDQLFRKATDDLNQITNALEARLGTDQLTVRFVLVENPQSGDDELTLALLEKEPGVPVPP